jgi:hypothetical protein
VRTHSPSCEHLGTVQTSAVDNGTTRVRISGLRKKLTRSTYGARDASRVIHIPSDTPVTCLKDVMIEENHGKPTKSLGLRSVTLSLGADIVASGFKAHLNAYGHTIHPTWEDVFTTEVRVTTGQPCYSLAKGLSINHEQSIASFFSRVFPDPIEATLDPEDTHQDSGKASDAAAASVRITRRGREILNISFMRTVRIPEDGGIYDLPPDLNEFPLFNVQAFSQRLSPSMAALGGLFIPTYRK